MTGRSIKVYPSIEFPFSFSCTGLGLSSDKSDLGVKGAFTYTDSVNRGFDSHQVRVVRNRDRPY